MTQPGDPHPGPLPQAGEGDRPRTVPPLPPAGEGWGEGRPPSPGTLTITSEKLFAGALEVQIDHHGALYRLKKTSLGKLILTK